MSISCCFHRLICDKGTQLKLHGDKIRNYVQILSNRLNIISNHMHITVIVCLYNYVHMISNFVF